MQIAAFSEATQSWANRRAAAQEHNLNYAQSFFESSLVLLEDHMERIYPLCHKAIQSNMIDLSQAYARELLIVYCDQYERIFHSNHAILQLETCQQRF